MNITRENIDRNVEKLEHSSNERSQLLRYLSTLPPSEQIKIFAPFHRDEPYLFLDSVTRKIKRHLEDNQPSSPLKSKSTVTPEQLDLYEEDRIRHWEIKNAKKVRNGKKKQEFELKYSRVVLNMRHRGTGWRSISKFLSEEFGYKISHTHLRKVFNEFV
jgi:hypothetical protein